MEKGIGTSGTRTERDQETRTNKPFRNTRARLETAVESDESTLRDAAHSERLLLETYGIALPPRLPSPPPGQVDGPSEDILQMLQPDLLRSHTPLAVYGDGNCLYRALSRAMYGTETYHILLRLLVTLEIVENRRYYDVDAPDYIDLIQDDRLVDASYEEVLGRAVHNAVYAHFFHMLAASAVLQLPFRSYCPPTDYPRFFAIPLTRPVCGRGVNRSHQPVFTLMWTQTTVPNTRNDFIPNHFVVLNKVKKTRLNAAVNWDDEWPPLPPPAFVSPAPSIMPMKKRRLGRPPQAAVTPPPATTTTPRSTPTPPPATTTTPRSTPTPPPATTTTPRSTPTPPPATTTTPRSTPTPPPATTTTPWSTPTPPPATTTTPRSTPTPPPATTTTPRSTPTPPPATTTTPRSTPTPPPATTTTPRSTPTPPQSITTTPPSRDPHPQSLGVPASGGKYLPGSKHDFLDIDTLVQELRSCTEPQAHVPRGVKENVYFLVDNSANASRRLSGKSSEYWDDCGAWSSKSRSVLTHFLSQPGRRLKKIVLRQGQYCLERQEKKRTVFYPLEPQPQEGNVVIVRRYYSRLARDERYEKRVSWLENPTDGTRQVACMEYRGSYPGDAPHGNSKPDGAAYVRMRPDVAADLRDSIKTNKPQVVYRNMKERARESADSADAPRNSKQVKNARYSAQKNARPEGNRGNFADHIQALENRVLYDPFVQRVCSSKDKVPTLTCYTKEQLYDIKRFCCAGPAGINTVLAFDKTYNLGEVHVTASAFKHLAVKRRDTGENPIFPGPMFIHGNSHFTSYAEFFCHVSSQLDSEYHPVVGTDDERGMRKAVLAAFPKGARISCVRHLKNNVADYLRDTVGMDAELREDVLKPLFGKDGVTSATSDMLFETLLDDAKDQAAEFPVYLDYLETRVEPILRENFATSQLPGFQQPLSNWTNNNCESLNHVLKQAVNWQPQALVNLVDTLHGVVRSQYTELERSLLGVGDYVLSQEFDRFGVHEVAWLRMTNDQRERHVRRFMMFQPPGIPQSVTSSDRQRIVTKPKNGGKKPGQRKRKRAARTTSI
ncbi:uncharacterized protein LOC144912839 [Branchiostoma floridae x Branchiostoma belcheri]